MSEVSKTADKLLAVLFELRDGKYASPQQISSRVQLNRTVTQRLLTTLLARGYVVRRDGAYALSRRIATLADAVQRPVRAIVDPVVEDLSRQLGETVVFQILDGADAVVLSESYQQRSTSLQARHEIGSRGLATANATGLAALAALAPARLGRHLADTGDDVLRERLGEIAQAGFAITSGELQAGISGIAVGVCFTNDSVGGLGIIVPSSHADALFSYRGPLERAARSIESTLA